MGRGQSSRWAGRRACPGWRRIGTDRSRRQVVVIAGRRTIRPWAVSAGRRHGDGPHHQNVAVTGIDRDAHLPAIRVDGAHLISFAVSHRRSLRHEALRAQDFPDLLDRLNRPKAGHRTGRERRRLRQGRTRRERDHNRAGSGFDRHGIPQSSRRPWRCGVRFASADHSADCGGAWAVIRRRAPSRRIGRPRPQWCKTR